MLVIGFSLITVNTGLFASFAGAFFLAAEALKATIATSASVVIFFILLFIFYY
jgi:hypothetical protein